MLGIMNDYEALFSKAPPPARPQMPLVETVGRLPSKRSLLADHRYQLEFLLDNVGTGNAYCSPIGRIQAASTAPKEPAVGPQNEGSPQISPIFAVNNNLIFNNVNFFDYNTTCEPISPVKINENTFLNQNQPPTFDFTPNFQPLYTSRDSTLHQSGSSSSLNSVDYNTNSPVTPIFDSDSSNPVWQDRFLNINELLLPHAFDFGFNAPIFTLDEDHVTSISPLDQGHVISQEDQPIAVDGEGSLLSYYQNHYVEISANQETVALGEEAELIETAAGSPPGHVIFDQSQQRFKNQQEIFDEIYRECEQRVKRSSRDSSISELNIDHEIIDQSGDPSFLGQPIINLDLDDVQTITPPPQPTVVVSSIGRKKRSRDPNSDEEDTPEMTRKKSTPKKLAAVVDLEGVTSLNSAHQSTCDSSESADESFEFSSNLDEFGDLDVKKKKQNRRAASKYRTKRKVERISLESERNKLEEENRKLKSIVDDRQREIDYLKNFLNEIRASRAAKKL